MSGIKNIFQQYGNINPTVKGKDIWARHDAFLQARIEVYCKVCGRTIDMPSGEGPGSYSMEIYQMELNHQIHRECAKELENRGVNY